MKNKFAGYAVVAAFFLTVHAEAVTPVRALPGVVDAPPPQAAPAASAPTPAVPASALSESENALYEQVRLLNQIPDEQLDDQVDPTLSILRKIYDQDGPLYPYLKKLLGRADVRGPLRPGTKAVLASLLSERWDTFNLSGNLWLAALNSPNVELRRRARQRLVSFIQPAHLPVLINLLKVPGPNIAAYEVLQEVTGQSLEPSVASWKNWWASTHGQMDLVAHLIGNTELFLHSNPVKPFPWQTFWYVPENIRNTSDAYAKRSEKEQMAVSQWNQTARGDAKHFLDQWGIVKPALDHVKHQPDERVTAFFEKLLSDPGLGDYASVILAWRGSKASLKVIQDAYAQYPSPGRALGRGSLGDATVFGDLLKLIEQSPLPLSQGIMDQNLHATVDGLRATGQLSAEQVFEFLTRQDFGLVSAATKSERKKAVKAARRWYEQNASNLIYDATRGTFNIPVSK